MEEKVNKDIDEKILKKETKNTKEKLKIKDSNIKVQTEPKIEKCLVLYINNQGIAVLFHDEGIMIKLNNDIKIDSSIKIIDVYYTGTYGKSDFICWIEK